jgi:phosphoenolpyruvate-protein phosphotransferase (PTS system enzyme I)
MKACQEVILNGVAINGGISIGTLFVVQDGQEPQISSRSIRKKEVVNEVKRFRDAIDFCKTDLKSLQCNLAEEGSKEAVKIIDTHIQMLEDPQMKDVVEKNICSSKKNTESVFRNVMSDYISRFEGSSAIAKQTRIDLKDLSHRILKKLHPSQSKPLDYYPSNAIVYASELIPSQVAETPASSVRGFITEHGAATSHVSLISRSKGFSYVCGIELTEIKEYNGTCVIMDANKGMIILNPSEESLAKYYRLEEERRHIFSYSFMSESKSETKDGKKLVVHANIDTLEDLDHLDEFHVEEIGLVRSEFLFLQGEKTAFDANHQYKLYKKLLKKTADRQINFRLFDIGADKLFFSWQTSEPNPALGVRSMRFLLEHRSILEAQLKALLKANVKGRVRILLPLVRDFMELEEFKVILKNVILELENKFGSKIIVPKIGCMVEVPAFALMADLFAKECDFLSIGSNDLTQYTLAIDRDNQVLHNCYQPIHPSVLQLMLRVKEACQKQNCELSICGQMASNPLMIPLIVGLGLETISCSLRTIPLIKNTIANLDAQQAQEITQMALKARCSQEIMDLLLASY